MSERVHRRKETRNPIPGGTVAVGSDWLKKQLQAVGRVAPGVTLTFSGVVSLRKRSNDQVIHIKVVATTKPLLFFRKRAYTRDSLCTCLQTYSKQLSKDSISTFFLKKIFDLAIKRNELLIHATTWKNLQKLMLGEKAIALKGSIQDDSV